VYRPTGWLAGSTETAHYANCPMLVGANIAQTPTNKPANTRKDNYLAPQTFGRLVVGQSLSLWNRCLRVYSGQQQASSRPHSERVRRISPSSVSPLLPLWAHRLLLVRLEPQIGDPIWGNNCSSMALLASCSLARLHCGQKMRVCRSLVADSLEQKSAWQRAARD